MNYYAARQRENDGRWDWTRMRDKVVVRVSPCAEHDDGHATAEEAERHFYEWELDHLRLVTFENTQERCEVCDEWTQRALQPRHGAIVMLCDAHRNREGYMQVRPFAPGMQIMSSW